MTMFIFFLIFFSIIYLGLLVYNKNPIGTDNRNFVFLSIVMAFWLLANFFENNISDLSVSSIFLKADFIIAPLMGFFWFVFCYDFQENKKPSIYKNIIFLFALLLSALTFFNLIIGKPYWNAGSSVIDFTRESLYPLYCLGIVIMFIGGPVLLIRKYNIKDQRSRMQIIYILLGLFFSAIWVGFINLFLQGNVNDEIFRIGSYGTLIFIFFTSYAIIKHKLFDIRSIIQRGIFYIILLALILFLFFALLVFSVNLFSITLGIGYLLSSIITIILGIYGVPILERNFRQWTDKFFFKDKYNYSDALYLLSEVLNKNIDLKILLVEMANTMKRTIKIGDICFYLPQQHLFLDQNGVIKEDVNILSPEMVKTIEAGGVSILICSENHEMIKKIEDEKGKVKSNKFKAIKLIDNFCLRFKSSLYVPIMLENKLIGLLLLGEKLSGDAYTGEDISLIRTFSNQAAVAIEKARLYEIEKEYAEALEIKVEERTRKIKDLQEEQRQTMLDIAHGLQTPLTIMRGELTSMREQLKNHEEIDAFERTIDKASKFVYDILRLAKMERSESVIEGKEFDLSELLTELVETFEIITGEKGIDVKHDIQKNIIFKGNRSEIEELLMNLVSNSVKYSKEDGEKWIKLALKKTKDDISIIVEDNGIGIGKEHIPCIFNRFYRATAKGKYANQGTGIGLAICKKIVEKHNGVIEVESELGKGTRFIMDFPV